MKKTISLKTLFTMLLIIILGAVSSVCVMAEETDLPPGNSLGVNSGSHTFSEAWEAYKSDDYGTYITYAFNTVLINEDYCWAEQEKLFHFGTIKNGKGWHDGPLKGSGKVSKIEVTHNGSSIYYACCWG